MIRILLIDDDLAIRNLIVYALTDEGYTVDEAADGHAALEIVERQHPDIIILDMKMPRMDGWQFVKLYRERYDHRSPIIVLTASQDDALRADDFDSESYMAKPFDLDALVKRIAEIAKSTGTTAHAVHDPSARSGKKVRPPSKPITKDKP